jgi:hypothetical protein
MVPLNYGTGGILVDHKRVMAALNLHGIVEDLRAIRTVGITHKGDALVVSVLIIVNLKTTGAGARISTVPVVVNVVILDRDAGLDKVREYDAAPRRVPNFKAVYGDI